MRTVKADLFSLRNDMNVNRIVWKLIPTNGGPLRTSDHACVMGRGVAKQFSELYPFAPYTLGMQILTSGNVPHVMGYWDMIYWISFPTKHRWDDKVADYQLISMSALRLKSMIDEAEPDVVILPKVGCGCGKLHWPKVKACLGLDGGFFTKKEVHIIVVEEP